MQDCDMSSGFLRVIGIVRPCVNSRCFRMTANLQNLDLGRAESPFGAVGIICDIRLDDLRYSMGMKGYLFAIVLAVHLPIHGQEERRKPTTNETHAQATKKPDTAKPPSPPNAGVVVNQEATNCQCNRAADNPKSYFSRLFSPENLPNIGLFFAGIVAIIVAICTLKIIVRQTAAIEKQANAMINSERAWVIVELIPICRRFDKVGWCRPVVNNWAQLSDEEIVAGEHRKHRLKVTNMGRTPATILRCQIEYSFVGGSEVKRIEVAGLDLALGGDKSTDRPIIDIDGLQSSLITEVGDSKKNVDFRGTVEYQTVFDASEVYVALFRYIYESEETWLKRMPQEKTTRNQQHPN